MRAPLTAAEVYACAERLADRLDLAISLGCCTVAARMHLRIYHALLRWAREEERRESASMTLGSATHKLTLEGREAFDLYFAVKPDPSRFPGVLRGVEAIAALRDARKSIRRAPFDVLMRIDAMPSKHPKVTP